MIFYSPGGYFAVLGDGFSIRNEAAPQPNKSDFFDLELVPKPHSAASEVNFGLQNRISDTKNAKYFETPIDF